jgi:hypothetical protein
MANARTPEEHLLSLAARIMGLKGGRAATEKKIKAGRENGKKGGRPKKKAQ